MEKQEIIEEAQAFMEEVKKIFTQRPYLLKRCPASPNVDFYKMFPKFAYKIANYQDQSYVYKIIASIYYFNPSESSKNKSLGISCKEYHKKNSSGSFEKRFLRFLNSDSRKYMFDSNNVLKLFKLLNNENISINYMNLFVDLWLWGDAIRDKYACDYYSINIKDEENI